MYFFVTTQGPKFLLNLIDSSLKAVNTICTMKKTNLESKISTLPLESQQALIEQPALFELIKELIEIIEKQQQEIAELRSEVKHLRDQLHLDSHNSSYPPSTDKNRTKSGKKVNNLRKSTTKKPGGQENHPGSTLRMVSSPDKVISHELQVCAHCHQEVKAEFPSGINQPVQYGESQKSSSIFESVSTPSL